MYSRKICLPFLPRHPPPKTAKTSRARTQTAIDEPRAKPSSAKQAATMATLAHNCEKETVKQVRFNHRRFKRFSFNMTDQERILENFDLRKSLAVFVWRHEIGTSENLNAVACHQQSIFPQRHIEFHPDSIDFGDRIATDLEERSVCGGGGMWWWC